MALHPPRLAKADVAETDGAPGEDGAQTAQRQQPGEQNLLGRRCRDERQKANGRGEEDCHQGPPALVNVRQHLRRLLLFRERGQRPRRAVDGRVADGENGDHDDRIHDRVEARDARVGDRDDKRRRVRVARRAADETAIVIGYQETHEGEGNDVEETDAPEDLLHGSGKRLARVGRLGRTEADEFGAGKGEGGGHEDGAKTFEAVVEGTGVLPVAFTDIGPVRATANIEDYPQNAAQC